MIGNPLRMKKAIFLFLIAGIVACHSSSSYLLFDNEKVEVYRPPGTIKVAENLYADEWEIGNVDYKEYLFWLQRVYGGESNIYKEALLDSTVWSQLNTECSLESVYYNHPSYGNYPVVGISLEQAKKYSTWRTERVAEMLLVQKGNVKYLPDQTSDNCFTIERYKTGNFYWIVKREDFIVARYKVPTEKEWELIAGVEKNQLGVDSLTRENRKGLKNGRHLFNVKEIYLSGYDTFNRDSSITSMPSPGMSFAKNIYGLYGTIGNVCEIVDEPETSKGGSFQHSIEEIEIEKSFEFKTPNYYTGFRNICSWEFVKI